MWKRFVLLAMLGLVIVGIAMLYYLATETRQLAGSVLDATTRTPIADAQVNAAGFRATTNAQGRYSITLPRGIYPLSVRADGYDSNQTELNGDDLFTRAFAVDFILQPSRLLVAVRDAETHQALPNVSVTVGDQTIPANAQGILDVRGVKTGTPFAANLPGYQPVSVVYDGHGDFDLLLTPNTLSLSVVNQYTNQPIANARIQVNNQALVVDAQGRLILRRVKPGTSVSVAATGFDGATTQYTGRDIHFVLRPNTLEGIVIDATTHQPISGTLIYLGENIVTTNAKGEYRIEIVPVKATLALKVPGYRKTQVDVSGVSRSDIKLTPFLVKGIHLPFGISQERWREAIDLTTKTELNAIVLSVKAERGRLMWDSQVPLARQVGAPFLQGVALSRVIEDCKTQNIYCIARLPVFQDNLLASSRPQLAARYANGTLFAETGGQQWLNPFLSENWNYVIALAKEIAAMGFDEIQFDYVRFPGLVNQIAWGTEYNETTRTAAIAGFLARAQKELRPTGVFISADVFGLTTATDDDQHTGQRLRDLGPYLDYVSPMVYPDTWVAAADLLTRGLKINNCTDAVRCPYDVIYNSYKRAEEKTTTKVRLWLQAYAGRGNFGVAQYREQKRAATDAGSYGWMFWNGQGIYDPKLFDSK